MGNVQRWLGIALALSLSGCATLTAPDEVKALQEATDDFSDALKGADLDMEAARQAYLVEEQRRFAASGQPVLLIASCAKSADKFSREFFSDRKGPYRSSIEDTIFSRIRLVEVCGLDRLAPELSKFEPEPDIDFSSSLPIKADAPSLTAAARNLKNYVLALSDIATGDSAGKSDAARAKLFAAGKGLLTALNAGPLVGPLVGLAEQVVKSLTAARRNAITREFLDRMDVHMPFLMERMGEAARTGAVQAILNRSRAAASIAAMGNEALIRRRGVVAGGVTSRTRVQIFDDVIARLAAQNASVLALRKNDPMIAARAFADAHHELTKVFRDPRAQRRLLAEGLADLSDAAADLADAVAEARGR